MDDYNSVCQSPAEAFKLIRSLSVICIRERNELDYNTFIIFQRYTYLSFILISHLSHCRYDKLIYNK